MIVSSPFARLHSLWQIQFPLPMNFQSGWHLQINSSLAIVLFILVLPFSKIMSTSFNRYHSIIPNSQIRFHCQLVSFDSISIKWPQTVSLQPFIQPPLNTCHIDQKRHLILCFALLWSAQLTLEYTQRSSSIPMFSVRPRAPAWYTTFIGHGKGGPGTGFPAKINCFSVTVSLVRIFSWQLPSER